MPVFSDSTECVMGEHMKCLLPTCLCDCHHGARGLVATITFANVSSESRASIKVYGSRESLDSRIIDAIDVLRNNGKRVVKTEFNLAGEDWVYEYDSTGHIESVFRRGEVTP